MFSYLDQLNSNIDSSIIKRGQKIFLDGGVQKLINLEIGGWQKTQVTDGSYSYSVIVPLTHQLLSRENWDKTYQVWQELSKCTCHYFLEAGVCRHIIAVASKLDWELQQQIIKTDTLDNSTSFIDLYNQVNSSQTINNLINQFDGLIISSYNPRQLTVLSRLTSSLRELDNENQVIFFGDLSLLILKHLKKYEEEKKIIKIILDTLKIDPNLWWSVWKDKVSLVSEHNWVYLINEIFGISIDPGYSQFKGINRKILAQITESAEITTKDKLIEEFKLDKNKLDSKSSVFEKTYKYAVAINNYNWLLTNLETIDPEKLVELIKILPPIHRDKIDRNIKNQLLQWIAFVPNSQKDEVFKLLLAWRDSGEISEYWYETIDYIKSTINPKTKLYKELKQITL